MPLSTGKPELPRVSEEPLPKPYSLAAEKLTPEKYYQLNEAVLIETGMTGVPHRPAPPPPSYRVQIAPTPGSAPPRSTESERPTFFGRKGPGAKLLVGIIGLLFFIAAGLAAGLGVSQRDLKQTKTSLQAARISLVRFVPFPAPVVYITDPLSSGQPTPSPVAPSADRPSDPAIDPPSDPPSKAGQVECPMINGTLYTVTNPTIVKSVTPDRLQFKLLCGLDFTGDREAVELGVVKTMNLTECADACAATTNCTGAGWGIIAGNGGPGHYCWMKTGLIRGHRAAPGWGFAVIPRNESLRR